MHPRNVCVFDPAVPYERAIDYTDLNVAEYRSFAAELEKRCRELGARNDARSPWALSLFVGALGAVEKQLAEIPSIEAERAAYRVAHEHAEKRVREVGAATTADVLVRARAELELAQRAEYAARAEFADAVQRAALPSLEMLPLYQGRSVALKERDTFAIVAVAASIANYEYGYSNRAYDLSWRSGVAEPDHFAWEVAFESDYLGDPNCRKCFEIRFERFARKHKIGAVAA